VAGKTTAGEEKLQEVRFKNPFISLKIDEKSVWKGVENSKKVERTVTFSEQTKSEFSPSNCVSTSELKRNVQLPNSVGERYS
jgi:hypothetical protein